MTRSSQPDPSSASVESPTFQIYSFDREVFRDQLAAVLRDAPRPMTSTELGASVTYVTGRTCTADHAALLNKQHAFHKHYEDGFDVWGYTGMAGGNIGRDLAVLERRGLAARTKRGRSVLWSWAGSEVPLSFVEDFPTPSADEVARWEVEDLMEALRARGVEVAWTDEPSWSQAGEQWAGFVELRRNGPLEQFIVMLWQNAPAERLADALRDAARRVETWRMWSEGDDDSDEAVAYCVGRLEDRK